MGIRTFVLSLCRIRLLIPTVSYYYIYEEIHISTNSLTSLGSTFCGKEISSRLIMVISNFIHMRHIKLNNKVMYTYRNAIVSLKYTIYFFY